MSERVKRWGSQKWVAGWNGGKTGPTCPSFSPVVAGDGWPCIPVGYGMETVAIAVAQNKGLASAQDIANLVAAAPALVEALEDLLSGWKYIREQHGELYGVGWDRGQEKAEAALSLAYGETQ